MLSPQYLNNVFSGFNSLKLLNIADNEYLKKLPAIINSVSGTQDKYKEISETLYNEFIKNAEKYTKSDTNKFLDSKNLQVDIIKDAYESFYLSASKLTPEIVKGLLQ